MVNFRNHKRAEFNFGQKTVITGDNGSGKSNILEAVYLMATGRSFRADSDLEMISYGEQLSVISCQLSVGGEVTSLQVSLTDGSLIARKKFNVNGVPRRMMDFAGKLKAVLFGPADMLLVTGSPAVRRRYLDFVMTQQDREYWRNLISYEKGLRQRNKLLDLIRDGKAGRTQLYFWDRLLIKNGTYITGKRADYLSSLNVQSSMSNPSTSLRMNVQYDKSVISEIRLKQYETQETAAGTTLVGPHRDDFTLEMEKRDVSKYGSRGEQRMAVLWLKMGELKYLTVEEQLPVLLLDDVFSELDHEHRAEILTLAVEHSDRGGQVIMSASDPHLTPSGRDWERIFLGEMQDK